MRVSTGHEDFKGRVRGESGGKQKYKYDRCRGSFGHGDPLLLAPFLLFSFDSCKRREGFFFFELSVLCLYTWMIGGHRWSIESVLEDIGGFRVTFGDCGDLSGVCLIRRVSQPDADAIL